MSANILADRGIRLRHYQPGEHRAPCPECDKGSRDDALAVRIDGDGSAAWLCHRCGFKGGIKPESRETPTRLLRDRNRRPPEPKPKPKQITLSPRGLDLWDSCSPIVPGTPAATYLDRRCCGVSPASLRWHPESRHWLSGHVGPALVGLVTDVLTVEPVSLHFTWLALDGRGKAELEKPRLFLPGHTSRGVVRLWQDAEVTLGVIVGEGLETVLSAAGIGGYAPAWAALNAGNLRVFPVLPGIEGITILVDHDPPNPKTGKRAGTEAALELIERYTKAGFDPVRDIQVVFPEIEGEDVNDLVMRLRGAT